MNDSERINWLGVRAATMFGKDPAKAAAASRDSARMGDAFRLALNRGLAPEDAMREAVDSASAMPVVLARMRA